MALKLYNPVSPGQRQLVTVDRSDLHKGRPVKALTVGLTSKGGRNNHGRLTVRHRGGGHKRLYRLVDFRRNIQGEAVVERLEYDPNRSAFIALIRYDGTGELSYILAPRHLKVGDKVVSGDNVEAKPGNAMPLASIPVGTLVHNVEMKPGKGGQISRAAGSYAQLVGKETNYVIMRLNSGEQRRFLSACRATVGVVSNSDNANISIGKAGRNRWLGKRPTVRGVAMNPIDHPHGGGEGRTSGGRHPVTPWGVITRGKRTRSNRSSDKDILSSRHQRKKR